MLTRLNVSLLSLLLLSSFSVHSATNLWKKSYQLEYKGKYAQAAAVIEGNTTRGRNKEYALLRFAYLNYMQGKYSDSIRAYKQAINLNPRTIDARLGITLPLMAQKRWRQARRYANQVLANSPWNFTAHVRLMLVEEGTRKWAKLSKHAKKVAERYPTDSTALVYLARAEAWQGNISEAKKAYRKVIIRVPAHIEANDFITKHTYKK